MSTQQEQPQVAKPVEAPKGAAAVVGEVGVAKGPQLKTEIDLINDCLANQTTIPAAERTLSFLAGFSGRKYIDAEREQFIANMPKVPDATTKKGRQEALRLQRENDAKLRRFDKLVAKFEEKQSKMDINIVRLQGNKEDGSTSASTPQEQALGFDIEQWQLGSAQESLSRTLASYKAEETRYTEAHVPLPREISAKIDALSARLKNVEERQQTVITERKKLSDADPKLAVNQVKVVAMGIARIVEGGANVPKAVADKIVADPVDYLTGVVAGAVEDPAQMARLKAAGILSDQSAAELTEAVKMVKEEEEITKDEHRKALEAQGKRLKGVAGMASLMTLLLAWVAMQKMRGGGGGG